MYAALQYVINFYIIMYSQFGLGLKHESVGVETIWSWTLTLGNDLPTEGFLLYTWSRS